MAQCSCFFWAFQTASVLLSNKSSNVICKIVYELHKNFTWQPFLWWNPITRTCKTGDSWLCFDSFILKTSIYVRDQQHKSFWVWNGLEMGRNFLSLPATFSADPILLNKFWFDKILVNKFSLETTNYIPPWHKQ